MNKNKQALADALNEIATMEQTLGKNHHDIADKYADLSQICQNMALFPEALAYQRKAIAIREQVLDKNHPDLATSYGNLVVLCYEMQDMTQAKDYLARAINIMQHNFPDGHPNLTTMLQLQEHINKMWPPTPKHDTPNTTISLNKHSNHPKIVKQ